MPTNEERRKVADRLRILAGHREVDKELIEDALELYMGGCIDGYDPVSVSKLADLIEPEPERTCENESSVSGIFTCSYCGADFYDTEISGDWNHCPNCGAKVVENEVTPTPL